MKKNKNKTILLSLVVLLIIVSTIAVFLMGTKKIYVYEKNSNLSFTVKKNEIVEKEIYIKNKNLKDYDIVIEQTRINNYKDNLLYSVYTDNKLIKKGIISEKEVNTILQNIDVNENKFKIRFENIDKSKKYNLNAKIKIVESNKREVSVLNNTFIEEETGYRYNLSDLMNKLAGGERNEFSGKFTGNKVSWFNFNNKIERIKILNKIDERYKEEKNIVSTKESSKPIYMWYENNTIYFYSENIISLPKDSSYIFSNLDGLYDIEDLKYMDTSKVEDFSYMFEGDSKLSEIKSISYFDTRNSKIMSGMFMFCNIRDVTPLSTFITTNVIDFRKMFSNCKKLEIIDGLYYFDVTKSINMDYMLSDTDISNVSAIEKWDVSNVKSFISMFSNTNIEDLTPLRNWKTKNAKNMDNMFYNTKITNTSALKNWNVKKVSSYIAMFSRCAKLKDINGLKKWKTTNAYNMSEMFSYTKITNLNALKNWKTKNVTDISKMFKECRNLNNIDGLSRWDTQNLNRMEETFSKTSIEDIEALKEWKTNNLFRLSETFAYTKIKNVEALRKWNVSNIEDFTGTFSETDLNNIEGISNWNTKNCKKYSIMFRNNKYLKDLSPISNWNVENGEEFYYIIDTNVEEKPKWNGTFDKEGTFTLKK